MANEFSEWFKNVPRFTRYWLALTVGFSLLGKFGFPPQYLILNSAFVFKKFQIWRLVTAVFYYPLNARTGFHFMLNLYFLYTYSQKLEVDQFKGRPADYFFLLIFNWTCCVIVGIVADLMLLMDPMVLSVLYIWCQLNKEVVVRFWFGTSFKAVYLPWVLLLMDFLLSDSGLYPLIGIVVGHLYFFLKFKYPQELNGPSLLETPNMLRKYFPDYRVMGGFGQPPINFNRPPRAEPNPWGRGQRLGHD